MLLSLIKQSLGENRTFSIIVEIDESLWWAALDK